MITLMDILRQSALNSRIEEELLEQKKNINVYGLPENAVPGFFLLQMQRNTPVLILTEDGGAARKMAGELRELDGSLQGVGVFPEWEIPPYRVYARSNENVRERLKILDGLLQGELHTIIGSIKSLMQPLIPRDVFERRRFCLETGEIWAVDELLNQFVSLGYESCSLVESPGQFSRRGGIVDVFSLSYDHPIRIEFFDEEVDSLRFFDQETQRSISGTDAVSVIPARETLLDESHRRKAATVLKKELSVALRNLTDQGLREQATKLEDDLIEDIEALEQDQYLESLDRWMNLYFGEETSLLEYFSEVPVVMADNFNLLVDQFDGEQILRAENYLDYIQEGLTLPRQSRLLRDTEKFYRLLAPATKIFFSALPRKQGRQSPDAIVDSKARTIPGYLGKSELFLEDLRNWIHQHRKVLIGIAQPRRLLFLKEQMEQAGLPWSAMPSSGKLDAVDPGTVVLVDGNLGRGFELPDEQLVLLGEREIFSSIRKEKRIRPSRKKRLSAFSQIDAGDYVVHGQYGIGRYRGITNIDTDGVRKDYLEIQYAREDKLFIPVEQIDLLERYVGSEGHNPRLSRLGTQDWEKVKTKVRSSVRDIAKELLKLYAQREMAVGFAFEQDTVWQKEFEDQFPYQETEDQLKAIEDTKRDMESLRPMDRIVVGDVGYGKTEVALRAAFKAVMNSRQVGVLVPTTVLATQHYGTFTQRFAQWPVRIEVINRFKSAKAHKEILDRLAHGEIDILIGTHRLLSKDIHFAKLGLVVVDEEQKFGVAHKEKLKAMRREVDFLTLTATPIPRTLHLSLSGAKDLSVIETPPEDRYPVQTYVLEESNELIQSAIRRELSRNGQVYYIHNRIGEMDRIKQKLEALVPEARLAVAHGRMPQHQLEESMLSFVEGEVDVLLCTTIVESGLDIGNVNTLIVDDADRLGLSQIYQLKGRIGRSSRLAYAYFTYKRNKVLSQIAEKRLRAIREFTEFGSGFKIAMRDMEIRGAGNILGAQQHGHMLTVGFDMYCQLLEEEVTRLQERKPKEERPADVRPTIPLHLQLESFLPDRYIPEEGVKMEFYKKIMATGKLGELQDLTDEMIDRYGEPPREAANLLGMSRLKILLMDLGAQSMEKRGNHIQLVFGGSPFDAQILSLLGGAFGREVLFSSGDNLEIRFVRGKRTDEEMLPILLKGTHLLSGGEKMESSSEKEVSVH